jgi:hypothetical protein
MRKLCIWCIGIVFFLGFYQVPHQQFVSASSPSKAYSWNHSIQQWYSVGYDYNHEPLKEDRHFPWQKTSTSTWGSDEYPMKSTLLGKNTHPVYYTCFYLDLIPDGGRTRGQQKYYVVVDDQGNIWLDPDGVFQNCIYQPQHDPKHPLYKEGGCEQANVLDGKIRYSFDPDPGNNTLGPYSVRTIIQGNNTTIKIQGRTFVVSLLDRIDYGTETYVDKSDWDSGLKLVPFQRTEKHTDNHIRNQQYDPYEDIYQCASASATTVQTGDIRRTPVVIDNETIYTPNSIVEPGDFDIGRSLVTFQENEMHSDQVQTDGLYTNSAKYGYTFFPEFIYRVTSPSLMQVQENSTRLTAVDIKMDPDNYVLIDAGIFSQDAFCLFEVSTTGKRLPMGFQTNLIHGMKDFFTVRIHSQNTDIPESFSSLSKGVLVEGDTYIFTSFISSIEPQYAGYMGIEWFYDNGVNNKRAIKTTPLIAKDLQDNFHLDGCAEEVLGLSDSSADLDFETTLFPIEDAICFYDASGNGLGVGDPIYRDRDRNYVVSEGDERMVHTICSVGLQTIEYSAGTTVTFGDADVGRVISSISSDYLWTDQGSKKTENDKNGRMDPGESIYKKASIRDKISKVQANDIRITSADVYGVQYKQGTIVKPMCHFYRYSKFYGVSMKYNGVFSYIDVPILPGVQPIQTRQSAPFQVEQTAELQIDLIPQKENQSVYIFIDEPSLISSTVPVPMSVRGVENTKKVGTEIFSITPFTSSLTTQKWKYPLSLLVFVDLPGVDYPFMDLEDPVYNAYFYQTEIDRREKRYKELLPDNFTPDYCTVLSFHVYPENATVKTSKDHVSNFDLRFPNLWGTLINEDNPLDVNDPYGVIASQSGDLIVGNYNAKGAGVDYLFTAYASMPSGVQRYIVQVNTDQSYCFWLWDDKAPEGVLDFSDGLYGPIFVYQQASFTNKDCSEEFFLYKEDPIGFNQITKNDEIGIFDGGDHEILFQDNTYRIVNARVETFGVDVLFETYGGLNEGDPGGDYPIALKPMYGEDTVYLRTYAKNALYDYNKSLLHPPCFMQIESGQIQYIGHRTIKTPTVNDINFTNLSIVDHGLQYSDVDYTAGKNPLSSLPEPTIVSPYNPIVRNWHLDFIAYPAGQAHVGRTSYRRRYSRGAGSFGFCATPTISSALYEESPFRKLGAEQFPMTDYDFMFTLQTKAGDFLSFGEETPSHLRINKIVVEGPFKCPQILDRNNGSVVPSSRIPLIYNDTGKLVIDRSIAKWYQMPGDDWTGSIGFGRDEIFFQQQDWNPLLVRTGILDYTGIPSVIKIPEITLLRSGVLHITVILADGTTVELGDCWSEEPFVGIPVHGLDFENIPESLEVFTDHVLKPTLYEKEPYQEVDLCNNAYVILWQDRGIRLHSAMALDPYEIGAGDGRINFGGGSWLDLNEDGKVSFADWETEIVGTYYVDTNCWAGGVFDGRTKNVDNGVYPLELTEETGTQITQYGVDFCSREGDNYSRRPDHIISTEEVTPIYLQAYKFYDDNGDRAFTPLFHGRSHEVYLAGEKSIRIQPHEDLFVTTYPSPLTAGCIAELVDPGNPLTIQVQDSSGTPMNFSFGVMDSSGRSDVDERDAWQHLFVDTPKEPLPQYYWTRTDLHNQDNIDACNAKMYSKPNNPFSPIRIDFKESHEGKYKFLNFVANDEGAFEVVVYSPDHLHMGRTYVTVAPPQIEYSIMPLVLDRHGNIRGAMDVRDPDFLMTAGVNKIYLLSVQAYTPQGVLIKGVDRKNPFRNEQTGETMSYSGRMTPYTTKPASFDLHEKFDNVPQGYFLHMSILQDLENISMDPSNTFQMAGFDGTEYATAETVYYNTSNVMYDNGLFSKTGRIEPNPTMILEDGWGYGCIYNRAHDGVYMFTDFNKDGMLTVEDSFSIDKNGEVWFFIYAEDVCNVGVLVNCNDFSSSSMFSDVVGRPPTFSDSPTTVYGRYRKNWDSINGYSMADGIFKLDWDAFPQRNISIRPPVPIIRDSETQLPIRRDLLNPSNYDLVYGITNSLHVYLQPADSRDLPIEGGWVHLQGNQHESSIYAGLEAVDRTNRRATLSYTPTGIGEATSSLLYSAENNLYILDPDTFTTPLRYVVDLGVDFDILKALDIKFPYKPDLIQNMENDLTIQIREKGTNAPVENVTVSVSGEGFSVTRLTNEEGQATFNIHPSPQKEKVRVYAMKKSYFEAESFISVVEP